jgi:antitoxin component of RelBE/YafQ-DinJ toxin-antitoxin module
MVPRTAAATVSVRIDDGLEKRLARFMRQSGITNQARALRLLLGMALTTAGVRE